MGQLVARGAATLLVVGAFLGGCSGDDEGSKATSPTSSPEAGASTTQAGEPGRACELIDGSALALVVGADLGPGEGSDNGCTFRSDDTVTAIVFNVAPLDGALPEDAVETARTSCDPDTAQPARLASGYLGFGCSIGGIPSVVVAGGGAFGLVTGLPMPASGPSEARTQSVAELVVGALERSTP
jgi:hypothetical protein